ncbi:hypothetical protein GJAV_G00263810 [Gymnothorax javanicus]|nr:hypothetical protein GJAV_G00263810 [Gymnothorax javanicus]
MAAVKALQQWCKMQCEGYRDVAITNMTTSFRNGLAFCALIHKHRPDLIDYDSLSKENVYENNDLAFRVAEDQLGIPALLDAEDMVALKVPDRLSILTYVSQYYNYFHGRAPIGGMAGIKRPADSSAEEPSGKKNAPVTAKPFPAKSAAEIRAPPAVTVTTPSKPSPKQTKAATEKKVLVENSNKSGTLSSSCAVCKGHVHLVQRHLVDGKLYHRNCFKCSECSCILLSGTYKAGSVPGTYMCTSHQKSAPFSGVLDKDRTATPRLGPTWLVNKNERTETPRPNSSLSTSTITTPKHQNVSSKNEKIETPRPNSSLSTSIITPPKNQTVSSKNEIETPHPNSSLSTSIFTMPKNQNVSSKNEKRETPRPNSSLSTSIFTTPKNQNVSSKNEKSETPRPNSSLSSSAVSTPKNQNVTSKNERSESPRPSSSLSTSTITTPKSQNVSSKNERSESPRPNSSLSTSIFTTPKNQIVSPKNERSESPHPNSSLSTSIFTTPKNKNVSSKNEKNETPHPNSSLSTSTITTPKNQIVSPKNERSESPHPSSSLSTSIFTTPKNQNVSSKNEKNETPRPNSSLSTSTITTPKNQNVSSKNEKSETPHANSLLSTSTINTPKIQNASSRPSTPAPASNVSTPTTTKIQEARKKFFETPPTEAADPPTSNWPPKATMESFGKGRVRLKWVEQEEKAKKAAEGNSNNNNTTHQSGLRPTDNKLSNKPSAAETPSWKKTQDSPGVGRLKPVEPFSSNIKDLSGSESPSEWRSKLKPVSKGPKTTDTKEPSVTTETKNPKAPLKPSLDQSTGPRQPLDNGTKSWGFQNGKGSSSNNASQPEVKSPKTKPDFIPKEEILKELDDIEHNLNELEKRGIELEKQLRRSEDDGEEDTSMDELMVDWFNLIRSKQVYMRRESELVYIAKTQDLEAQQPGVEGELRRLLDKPERLKTAADRRREEELMKKLVEIVNDRNAIVEGLDEDRLREEEEDQQMNQLMQDLDIKKDKNKKKSPMQKLFGWKS